MRMEQQELLKWNEESEKPDQRSKFRCGICQKRMVKPIVFSNVCQQPSEHFFCSETCKIIFVRFLQQKQRSKTETSRFYIGEFIIQSIEASEEAII